MTPVTSPPALVPTQLPDLRSVSLAEMPDAAALGEVVARVLPGCPVETVPLGTAFSSSI